ncbi:MAG: hypothetical protein MZU95_03255 [Desulfomicrobium escambiense]|nr:hypothetical protein [Desulfomicrobium escambiense]
MRATRPGVPRRSPSSTARPLAWSRSRTAAAMRPRCEGRDRRRDRRIGAAASSRRRGPSLTRSSSCSRAHGTSGRLVPCARRACQSRGRRARDRRTTPGGGSSRSTYDGSDGTLPPGSPRHRCSRAHARWVLPRRAAPNREDRSRSAPAPRRAAAVDASGAAAARRRRPGRGSRRSRPAAPPRPRTRRTASRPRARRCGASLAAAPRGGSRTTRPRFTHNNALDAPASRRGRRLPSAPRPRHGPSPRRGAARLPGHDVEEDRHPRRRRPQGEAAPRPPPDGDPVGRRGQRRLHLLRADRLAAPRRARRVVKLWDQDVTTDEHIGTGRQKLDGELPIVFDVERDWSFQCRVVPQPQVGGLLAARLKPLDAALAQLALPARPARRRLGPAAAGGGPCRATSWSRPPPWRAGPSPRSSSACGATTRSRRAGPAGCASSSRPPCARSPPTQPVDLPAARLRGRVLEELWRDARLPAHPRGPEHRRAGAAARARERPWGYQDLQVVLADGSLHEARIDLVDDGTATVRLAPGATARLRVATRFSGEAGPVRLVELIARQPLAQGVAAGEIARRAARRSTLTTPAASPA